jgi:hypothetical protein
MFASIQCRRELTERIMPPRKQSRRLEDLAIRQFSDRYIRKCEKWMHDLKDAVRYTTDVYMNVSERVLNECLAVEAELLAKPPRGLKLLSPPVTEEFYKLFVEYAYFVVWECA